MLQWLKNVLHSDLCTFTWSPCESQIMFGLNQQFSKKIKNYFIMDYLSPQFFSNSNFFCISAIITSVIQNVSWGHALTWFLGVLEIKGGKKEYAIINIS